MKCVDLARDITIQLGVDDGLDVYGQVLLTLNRPGYLVEARVCVDGPTVNFFELSRKKADWSAKGESSN